VFVYFSFLLRKISSVYLLRKMCNVPIFLYQIRQIAIIAIFVVLLR